ncbi:hypothetical protein KPSA1_03874 [Pseudomonas syringae pv. actinidiae]|uniref:Uncharacterized protein n=1 Tax=Pseudomonas syringae pv. actinidiae TaxID=103796 RepID=A0A2V0QBK8_PSESF|nr:hypothetical protein KPSA1_03874 [Pseudomonas syringae pv. actinidiae]
MTYSQNYGFSHNLMDLIVSKSKGAASLAELI